MSSDDETTSVRRLFLGNLSPLLVKDPKDITDRLSKFGSLKSELELHYNEIRQVSFGYIMIDIDDKNYSKLKNSLNGVNYKGSKLVIDIAKSNYKDNWIKDNSNKILQIDKNAQLLKQQYDHYKKITNINKTYKDHQEIINGRLRKTNRKPTDLKKLTLRIKINGIVKILKCHKTKLWGVEKNKKLRDLVYKFNNGSWKDGNDHIVERISNIKIKQNGNVLSIDRINDDEALAEVVANQSDNDDDEDDVQVEVEKNTKVLASILDTFDFDKKIEYKEELDEFGSSDYEIEGAFKSDDEEEVNNASNGNYISKEIEYVKEGEFSRASNVEQYHSEDEDEDIEIDDVQVDQEEEQPQEEQQPQDSEEPYQDNDDEDTEFLPTFGAVETTTPEIIPKVSQGTISNTETLRTLFNTNEDEGFKLIEDSDEDIDANSGNIQTDVEIQPITTVSIIPKSKKNRNLFFIHKESPFLSAQTQLNKLNNGVDLNDWDETFWNKRSEWTKDFKNRRRDVLRQLRKKNAKNSRVFI